MKSLTISLLFSFAVAIAALFAVYPWSQAQGESSFTWQETLISYLALAGLMAMLAGFLLPLLMRNVLTGPGAKFKAGAVFAAASLATILMLVVLFSGPGFFLNVPGTRVRGLFFSEWQFVTYFFQVGIPFSVCNGGLQLWLHGKATTRVARH